MNAPVIDPLQGDFPEVIEEFLHHGVMKCIAFNRRGTLLAAGCSNGSCVIWDFETRGIAKELKDKDCGAPITSVCWSKYGHRILVSAADKTLILWDVVTGEKIAHKTLEKTALLARLHPGSSTPSLCLACPLYSSPLFIDLNTGHTSVLPVSVSEGVDALASSRNKVADNSAPLTPSCFNKHGDLIYLGNSKGEILVIDHQSCQVRAVVPVPGIAVIKNITFSRNGQYLLTNSSDRTIRVFENRLPIKCGLKTLDEISNTLNELSDEVEKLKVVGSKCLVPCHEFQDSINKIHWKAPCFSGNGEWVICGSASKGEHKIYIWDREGHLVKILEGPKEALVDLAWHPVHPIIVSVSLTGLVYIWAKDYTENWSAFAPDFKELEENEEYVEREDEFDIIPEAEKVKESEVNQDEEVDIMTLEKESTDSDSDMPMEELRFLPAIPLPDAPVKQDMCIESSVKSAENNHSSSLLSAEDLQNGQSTLHEGTDKSVAEDASAASLKRRRKPSEKGLEMQAEKVNKPVKKLVKSTSKPLKQRGKSVIDEDTSGFADDYSDDYQ